jgi:hypothetical protein
MLLSRFDQGVSIGVPWKRGACGNGWYLEFSGTVHGEAQSNQVCNMYNFAVLDVLKGFLFFSVCWFSCSLENLILVKDILRFLAICC